MLGRLFGRRKPVLKEKPVIARQINKELLEDLHLARLVYYELDTHIASTPKRLFIDGKFNRDNWNGGDADIIREICNRIVVEEDIFRDSVFVREGTTLHIRYEFIEDDWRVYFYFKDKDKEEEYTIGWYKSRGRTEVVTHNDHTMVEDEYIEFINRLLSVTGYKYYVIS